MGEIPDYQPFYLETLAALEAEVGRLGLNLALENDPASLAKPRQIGARIVPNRFCAQPIAGGDAAPSGAPGELTRRRYLRYAAGGFGLIWMESTLAGGLSGRGQLCLIDGTMAEFRALVREMRQAAPSDPTIILQLTAPAETDEEVERAGEHLARAAALVAEAGFDGVDLQACRGALAARLLRAFDRPGPYGGSFDNRSRFLRETLAAIHTQAPGLLLATRLCAYDAVRHGFGVSATDFRKPDPAEPARLVRMLQEAGLALLNVTAASPNLRGPAAERPVQARSDAENPDEHPLMTLARQLHLAGALREAAPGLAVVASGFSWLREFVPQAAAGALQQGALDFAGLGRGALAYPHAPAELQARGAMAVGSACMVCFACSHLQSAHEPVGCVLRDPEVYGPIYRAARRFDSDHLLAGARRCHFCEAAPCVAASPTRTPIPAFIQAFLRGDERAAYELIRARDPLPELTSRLSPAWLESEGACIETTLTGTSVPILDLQYTIAWRARDRGETGARLPVDGTGRSIAIVGGGPAGIAAALRLLESGHTVELFERSERLGGAPGRVIPDSRLSEVRAEIDALLRPAIEVERFHLHPGAALGENLTLESLRTDHAAVLLATGLWQERSLGVMPGVVSALALLEAAKRGSPPAIPARVALLAGGDSAMDAARTLQVLGAQEIFVVFGGPRSAMHWHLPESWFATPGVHAMMEWQPLGFVADEAGQLRALRIRHAGLGLESELPVGLAVEAMALQIADSLRVALPGLSLTAPRTNLERIYAAGALINGGASVGRCVAEGVAAAEAIHHDLTP